jgi:hypothetical protein
MAGPSSVLFRQARIAAGSIRAPANQTVKRQVRMASSSSASSSSYTSSRSIQKIAPLALAATIFAGGIVYSNPPLYMESAKRKSYAERMIIEKKEREQAKEKEDDTSSSSSQKKGQETEESEDHGECS